MKDKGLTSIIFASVATIIFILSYNSIWITDCITYKYSFATGEKIGSIGDIFTSQYVHYFTWNGRYVAHWLCQLFLPILGKATFSAVNALMYAALIRLTLKLAGRQSPSFSSVLTATCLVLFFCDTDYSPTCQIGYIWMAVLTTGFLCLFFNFAELDSNSAWNSLWLFPFSIIAGNGQEAINIGVGGALIVHGLVNLKRMSEAQWCMFVGFGIGGLFLCLSPASIGRAGNMAVSPVYSVVSFFLNLRVTYVLIIILACKLLKRQITLREFYHDNAFFINATLILLAFNFLIGVGSNRQLFGIELFSCIIVLKLLSGQSFSTPVLWVSSILIVGIYVFKYKEIKKAEAIYHEISAKISVNPDGPIFIDFPKFSRFIRLTSFFRHGVYLDYVVKSIRNEQADKIVDGKTVPCYPTKVEDFLKDEVTNRSHEYLPGEFVLIQSKKEPGTFVLHRSIDIFGISVPIDPYQVEFDPSSGLNTEEYNIMYLPEILPMIKNEYVEIE